MSVVVLANFGRAMLAPWSNTDELSDFEKFLNGLLYLGFTGYFITLLLVGFCLHLRSQFNGMVESKFPVLSTVGSDLVLFGDPMHCVEFMQCVVMSCNYYVTLFVTGIVQTIPGNYRIASIALFLIPIVVITVLCSWALWALSIMSLLGGLHKPSNKATVERVVRLLRGEGVSDEDDSNDDDNAAEYSDDEAIQSTLGHAPRIDKKLASKTLAAKDNAQKAKKKKPGQLLKVQKLDIDSPADNLARPLWLDPDEDWDASGTVEAGTARQSGLVDAVYLRNVDPREFQQALREAAPHLVEGGATANEAGHKCEASDEARDRTCRDGKKRPVWLDSDEDLDEQAL
jgi:hypothetical protein